MLSTLSRRRAVRSPEPHLKTTQLPQRLQMFHLPPTALPGAALPWDRWRGPLPGDRPAMGPLP